MWVLVAALTLTGAVQAAPAAAAQTAPAVAAQATPAVAVTTFDQWWPEVATRLERGALTGKDVDLREARGILLRGLGTQLTPAQSGLAGYALGYADWRLVRVPGLKKEEVISLLEEAAARLQEVVAADPKNAEAQALLAGVYGSQMGFVASLGVELGPKASAALEKAVKLEPTNPRVVFLQGTSAFHTPPAYGGSVEKAEALYKKALILFETEPRDRPWPNWGRADLHVWMGQLLEKRGDTTGARAEYNKALAAEPTFGWVKHVLLPRLEAAPK